MAKHISPKDIQNWLEENGFKKGKDFDNFLEEKRRDHVLFLALLRSSVAKEIEALKEEETGLYSYLPARCKTYRRPVHRSRLAALFTETGWQPRSTHN